MHTENNQPTIIFDGDDTLWKTQPLYEEAKEKFERLLQKTLSLSEGYRQALEETDSKNVELYGFSADRFPRSLVDSYRHYCAVSNLPVDVDAEKQALEIGREVFAKIARNVPRAETVLKELSRFYRLILATKGDEAVQKKRIKESNLEEYFSSIYILERKSVDDLLSIIDAENLNPNLTWVVGNSFRSDILPALQAGINAVLIPADTWKYEDHPITDHPCLYELKSLEQLLEFFEQRHVVTI